METVLIYISKMILCSAVLFAYYHLALKNRTFHHYNRFYLLAAVMVSLLLPLLKISYFTLEVNSNIYLLLSSLHYSESSFSKGNDPIYFSISLLSAGAVGVFLLSKLAVGIFKIRSFRRRFPKEELRGISFYHTDLEDAPFSFFKSLFWKNSILLNSDLGKQILKHEMVHIEQKHSSDKLFMEIVCSVLWFNPVFWLIKKEIYLIHEYLADNKAVKNLDTKAFVQMLLASHFSGNSSPVINPFLSSNLKKRLKMLQKPKTKFGYLHRILALPLVFTMAFAYAVNTKNIEIAELNADILKIIDEREAVAVMEKTEISEEAVSGTSVTDVQGVKADTVKSSQKQSKTVKSYDPMALNLFRATDENLFIVNGKEVLREDFIKFYLANRNDKKYSFGSTNQTFSKIFESGKTAAFSVFKEGADEETKKTLAIIGRYLNMPKEDTTLNPVPKSTASIIKRNNGELKNFFDKAEKERNEQAQNTARKKAEMDARIKDLVKSSKYKDNYFPGRNYNLQPLTAEETADLKEEASKIEKIVSESAGSSSFFMNFFRTNALSNYTFNLNGELLNEDKINRRDIVLPLNSDHTTFYMDGKKVPRDKVMKRTDSAADAETFLNDTNIKEIKQEYVTDGIRKYLYRFELITK
ncbi:M56 family metallopeptidase [Chryseobacterium sp.]|uniref:M56 family metallopeptidase n=1 Tax=Chryseobacterium sp. TaxID=1871047 RepID=UPI0012AA8457|nr:M56 family metallopeptidase [Chryseobacterium sp.]QFG53043.1 M56 family metallopeptidase [Chryseobacterium sp.]